jgi:serine/threonine protein kinase/class 3 adenylate cyclase/uncharacterized protein YjbI with pentapeptide repeats
VSKKNSRINDLNLSLKRQVDELIDKNRKIEIELESLRTSNSTESESPTHILSIEGLETLLLRLDLKGHIQYANSAFCQKFALEKEDLIGTHSSTLRKVMDESILDIVENFDGETSTHLINDEDGTTFEIKISKTQDFTDVIFQDVSSEHRFKQYVSRYVSSDLDQLEEDDLSTFKYPERRFMSVSFTDLRNFTSMSETLLPEDVRTTVNAFLEEIIHAIDVNKGTVDKIVGDEVMALYGAPKHYEDHALRAIVTCCDQIFNLKALQKMFSQVGKHMPACGIGINTGEMVVGNMGSSTRQDYTVLGSSVNLAARICGAARELEVLITESTLFTALGSLPDSWTSEEEKTDVTAKIETLGGKTEGVFPLAENLERKIIHIGPIDEEGELKKEFSFQYIYAIKVKGVTEPLPVISVIDQRTGRGEQVLDDKKLNTENNERIFGKYRLLELIGRGGMGEVHKARDAFGNIVALKTLTAGDAASEQQLKRFKREAEVMTQLNHRSICRIIEVGEVDKQVYIAMEYIEGVSLSEVLKHQGGDSSTHDSNSRSEITDLINDVQSQQPKTRSYDDNDDDKLEGEKKHYFVLNRAISIPLIIKVCEAVAFAHSHGILHRDLKPANIMLRKDGEPVLMDFGLAKFDTETGNEGMSMSMSGQVMGTIEYMSPEQAQSSKSVDEQTDVYSIGAILYQMLTGERHFHSTGNIISDANALQNHTPKRPSLVNRHVETDLEIVTMKALRVEKQERYGTVRNFQRDVQRYQLGEVISAKEVTLWEVFGKLVKRNKAMSTVVAGSVLMMVGLMSYTLYSINAEKVIAQKERKVAEEQKHIAESALRRFELEKKQKEKAESEKSKMKAEQSVGWDQLVKYNFSPENPIPKGLELVGQYQPQEGGGINLAFGAPLSQINWTESTDSEMKVELLMSCNGYLNLQVGFNDAELNYGRYFVINDNVSSLQTYTPEYKILWNGRPSSQQDTLGEKTHRVVLWREQHTYFAKLNGELLFEYNDPNSLPLGRRTTISIHRHAPTNPLKLHSLKISRKQAANLVSVLEPGYHFKHAGFYEKARVYFQQISEIGKTPDIRREAAYLTAIIRGELTYEEFLSKLKNIAVDPNQPFRFEAMHQIALSASKEQDWPKAKRFLFDVARHKPELQTIVNLDETFNHYLRDLPHDEKLTFLKILRDGSPDKLDLENMGITDLGFLKGFELQELNLKGNPIVNLGPLAEASVAKLNLDETGVTDLSPLSNMNLERLTIDATPVTDLGPLSGKTMVLFSCAHSKELVDLSSLKNFKTKIFNMPGSNLMGVDALAKIEASYFRLSRCQLTHVDFLKKRSFNKLVLEGNPLKNLNGLRGTKISTRLSLGQCQISDLSPLAQCQLPGIVLLNNNPFEDISALKGQKIHSLNLIDTKVKDLLPLAGMPLSVLKLSGAPVIDVAPLKDCQELQSLDLSSTQVSDTSPLTKLGLKSLSLSNTPIINFSVLTRFKSLESLSLNDTAFSDTSALKGMQLKHLHLSNTKVTDLSPLKEMTLKSLNLSNTKVTDLTPLKDMDTLSTLHISDTPVSDISPLRGKHFHVLNLSRTRIKDFSPLKSMKHISWLIMEGVELTPEIKELTSMKHIKFVRFVEKDE